MITKDEREKGYITLKEASERFGYAPDYIGQLIRKGKIEGKQVYANVAWVTTVSAMEAYIAGEKERRRRDSDSSLFGWLMQKLLAQQGSRILRLVLMGIAVMLVGLFIVLFYLISVAVDHRLSREREAYLNAELPLLVEQAAMLANDASDEQLFAHPTPGYGQ